MADVAQQVERRVVVPNVVGSSPIVRPKFALWLVDFKLKSFLFLSTSVFAFFWLHFLLQ